AYVGGSCLKISGSADTEYLHLFKSAIIPNANNKIVVRYRLLNGEADINLVLSQGSDPSKVKHTLKGVLTVAESSEKADQSFDINSDDRWVTKVFNLTQVQANQYKTSNGGIGVIGLEFKNAKNLELLLGEFGIYPSGSATATEDVISNSQTPAAPQITKTTILASNQYGLDAKMVWTLDGGAGRAAGTPVYNADKGVSMFKMYAQEEGGEETFMGVTTSWAGLMYKCPVSLGSNKKVRFGVSAVSADTRSESAIAWSAYMAKPDYALNDNITIDKPVLKANESFSFGFVDPQHEPAEWTLVDESGKTVLTASGHTIQVPNGLPEEGGYTLYINKGQDTERVFGYYVQVSGDKVGAVPQIVSVTRDGETITESSADVQITLDENPRLAFTGRKADGNASRAVGLASTYFGAKIGDLGIGALQSLSVAGWFKFKEIPNMGWHFMNISDRTTAWPNNEWGWTWNDGTAEGRYESRFRGAASGNTLGEVHYSFPDVRFQAGIWTHIAWICEYTTEPQAGFRHQLYINGVKQDGFVTAYVKGNGQEGNTAVRTVNGVTYDGTVSSDTFVWGQTFPIGSNEYVYFGGPKHQEAAVDGVVDDFQVWNKAMSQEDVNVSMNGFPNGYPEGLLSIWDFEDNYGDDFTFKSKGAKTGVSCSTFQTEVIKNEAGQETGSRIISIVSGFEAGCPFLSGTAMPVETKATWSDNFRQTNFDTNFVGATEGEGGTALVEFNDEGDHNVKLSLENLYGKDEFQFPIFTVSALAGIGEVDADSEGFDAYTEGNVLFLEFAADGVYDVQVYNVGGMLIANKELSALAGQSAQVSLGTAGVYLVKAVKDGKVLRTVKVLSK
ncbi:MAG: hypothetical protein K2H74_08465, partial [Paramuribaculum sp.]|nr:hypothetical protein [Paramuribaculum sp.]